MFVRKENSSYLGLLSEIKTKTGLFEATLKCGDALNLKSY